ncbi:radical SAM/SPASM domain-containing protein [Endomicrobiia bacterium]|nr:radical SAM/SPASM domain-containing protein [Endomicrobiia bacterium]
MAFVKGKECYFSNYVIFEEVCNNEYVLIHSYLNNIDIINEDVAKSLIKIKAGNNVDILEEETFNQLFQKGYLVDDIDKDRERFFKIADKLAQMKNKATSFIFIPSYDCNFSCPYCFEHELTRNKDNKTMSKETVDAIFEVIKKQKADDQYISLSMFGGEPLLKENIAINEYIFNNAKQTKLKLDVITNGYDLEHYFKFFKDGVFSNIQITLDGGKEYHNNMKYAKDNKNTFDKIIHNIASVLSIPGKFSIAIRINTNKDNIDSLLSLKETFETHGFLKDKRFNFYTKNVDECKCRKSKELSDVDIVHKIRFFDDNMKNMKTNSQFSHIISEFEEIFDPKKKLGRYKVKYCGANENNQLIDPLGDVYSCLEEVGKKDRRVGFLDMQNNKIVDTPLRKVWQNRLVQNIKECSVCKLSFICSGGCSIAALKYNGSLNKSYCAEINEICKEVIYEIVKGLTVDKI